MNGFCYRRINRKIVLFVMTVSTSFGYIKSAYAAQINEISIDKQIISQDYSDIEEDKITEKWMTDDKYCGAELHMEHEDIGSSFDAISVEETNSKNNVQSGTCGENLTWELDNGKLTISGTGTRMYFYADNKAPWYGMEIKKVIISEGIRNIASHAFEDSVYLEEVTIPDSVTVIGSIAFSDCENLSKINIPSHVHSIGGGAFARCKSLENISIPSTLTSIESDTFHGCLNLTSIEIPSNVTVIGKGAFSECEKLKYIKSLSGLKEIGSEAFYDCKSLSNIDLYSELTNIGDSAFYGCESLQSIRIPSNVTEIKESTFEGCTSLKNIEIAANISDIENCAFENCSSLTNIILPDSLKNMGISVFRDCNSLKSIVLSSSISKIEANTFCGCNNLTDVKIQSSIESIGSNAFYNCSSLTNIELPSSVKSIESGAFEGCTNLKSIIFPSGVTRIQSRTFLNCEKLTDISIPLDVKSIGNKAFYGCKSISSILIPPKVDDLGDEVFYGCESLQSIEMPSSITSIGVSAFSNCKNLSSIELSPNIDEIARNGFSECIKLENISIPTGVRVIWNNAFNRCSSLTTVYIPLDVSIIYSNAFASCNELSDVYYAGDEKSWRKIVVENYNEPLLAATIHYNSSMPEELHRVSFESNGGTNISSVKVKHGKTVARPTDPVKSDYDFVGWYKDEALTQKYDFSTPVTTDITLYAKWEKILDPGYSLYGIDLNFAGGNETLLWGDELFDEKSEFYYKSTEYQKGLAIAGLYLSDQAQFGKESEEAALEKLGFNTTKKESKYFDAIYSVNPDTPAYSIGSRKIITIDGKNKVVIALTVRGTRGDLGTLGIDFSSKDFMGGVFNGFLKAGSNTYNCLVQYIQTYYSDYNKENIILFITGHSLGGAVAGQVTRMAINDGYLINNTYTYTFASPNYDTQQNIISDYNCAFNIVHDIDVVPTVPYGYKRIGTDLYYGNVFSLAEQMWVGSNNVLSCHVTSTYLRCIRTGTLYKTIRDGKHASIHCPVDIEVYNANNNLIAKTIGDNTNYYGAGDVIVYTNDDTKEIYSVANSKYSIKIVGTDNGKMDYEVEYYDAEKGKITSAVKYSNIDIIKNKTFGSNIASDKKVENTLLFVTDDSGEPIREVKKDGTEESITQTVKGDVTGDDEIAMNDVIKVARAVAGSVVLTEEEKVAADVTGDGEIGMGDVIKLARYVAGSITEL